jgi:serine/threonine protein kinase
MATGMDSANHSSSNFLDLELEAASGYVDTPDSIGDLEVAPEIPESSHSSSKVWTDTTLESHADSSRLGLNRAKEYRRRQTSFAKHTRMSLIASAVNPSGSMLQGRKSLFIRPPQASFRPSEKPLLEKLDMEPEFAPQESMLTEELACSCQAVLNNGGILELIFGFLQESELLCSVSLISTKWADAAAQAHANMMLMSVGCLGNSEESEGYDSDDEEEPMVEKGLPVPGLMDREWNYLVSSFPWACFLSEGAFKKVYKVFNGNHRVEEAVSVMDVDMIESTGNMSVVGAELAVSVLLSSLVRRGVCPNFVVTRGVFSCVHEPPARYWGTSDNKRPKGPSYVSPKVKRLPKEPEQNKRGRYQYIRMELCDEGDVEEYLKRQPNEALSITEAMKLLFQMAFALHSAADRFSLKHYDVKLLNVFLQGVKSEKSGDVIMRYGLGEHNFTLRSARGSGIIAKLADYGTANVDSDSCGQPVTIGQFTTLENTPTDFLILGDTAYQGHEHDCFGLGLCMLHLFTGHAPYEEILEEVNCPPNLKKELRMLWENDEEPEYSVIRSLILSDVYKDEEGHIIEGEPDEVLYDTLYRFLVLFGIPDLPAQLSGSKVWAAVKRTLGSNKAGKGKGARTYGGKKNRRNDVTHYNRDRNKYSLSRGSNKYIARAREALESIDGGMNLLLSLVSFDPQSRATALDVLNSPFFTPLRETGENAEYGEQDHVLSYNAFST